MQLLKKLFMKGMVEMKKTFQKIIVSILTIALIASIGIIVPAFAEETAEHAAMYFDNTYADFWISQDAPSIVVTDKTSALYSTMTTYSTSASSMKYKDASATNNKEAESAYAYNFGYTEDKTGEQAVNCSSNSELVIQLPEKKGYKLLAVGVRITGAQGTDSAAKVGDNFAFSSSSDGSVYSALSHSITGYLGYLNGQGAVNETVNIPDGANFLKIVLKNDYTTKYSAFLRVFGFTFTYIPLDNNDVLTVSAIKNNEIVNLMSSGLMGDNSSSWRLIKTEQEDIYGLALVNYGSTGTLYEAEINSLDDYKITLFSLKDNRKSNSSAIMKYSLGNTTVYNTINDSARREISASSAVGENTLAVEAPKYEAYGITDITITMKRNAAELGFAVTNAVVSTENVTATVEISNISASENDTMILLVAGYDGTAMTDVDIIPVSKEDVSNNYTATLSKNTKKVRAFLWKDLSTILPILEPTTEFSVTQ